MRAKSMGARTRWLAGVLLTFVLVGAETRAGEPAVAGGQVLAVPAMALRDLDGGLHKVEDALGQGPLVIFFWSVYCPNCKEAMPGLVSLYGRQRQAGMKVWAVNVDGDRFSNAVRAFVEDLKLPFPVVFDRLEGELLVAADPLGVSKTPTLFVADSKGKILLRQTVDMDYDAVEESLGSAR